MVALPSLLTSVTVCPTNDAWICCPRTYVPGPESASVIRPTRCPGITTEFFCLAPLPEPRETEAAIVWLAGNVRIGFITILTLLLFLNGGRLEQDVSISLGPLTVLFFMLGIDDLDRLIEQAKQDIKVWMNQRVATPQPLCFRCWNGHNRTQKITTIRWLTGWLVCCMFIWLLLSVRAQAQP